MDGMPKLEILPAGELSLYHGVMGPLLLNTRHPRAMWPVRLAFHAASDELRLFADTRQPFPQRLGAFGFIWVNGPTEPAKYICFKSGQVALFPARIPHRSAAEWLECTDQVAIRSAGFVTIDTEGMASTGVHCYGESISLDRVSYGEEDDERLATMLGPHLFEAKIDP